MKKKIAVTVAGLAALGIAGGSIASGASASGPAGSRLDDGASLAPKAKVSEAQATAAAQGAASGALNETDLEYAEGNLVYNVDVGSHDVKVDAGSGKVVSVDSDD